jgi:eukaryotic-like serine/threonine-protein kinase
VAARRKLRECQLRLGDYEKADASWRSSLATSPPDSKDWDGYVEFCLFRGRPDQNRTYCIALLRRFGATGDAQLAERTGRACLLSPASSEMLAEATVLIDRALADKKPELAWAQPYFMVAKGLAEYRHGRMENAISTMNGPARTALQSLPGLVSAMARHRLGRKDEALATFSAAILKTDWRKSEADNREKWIYHILRREAESMMLPDLAAVLEGRHRPKSNDEKRCLMGICRFEGRYRVAAELYVEIMASDARLSDDLNSRTRFLAACSAALAGLGSDRDPRRLDEAGLLRWRNQARLVAGRSGFGQKTLEIQRGRAARISENHLERLGDRPRSGRIARSGRMQGTASRGTESVPDLCDQLRVLTDETKD